MRGEDLRLASPAEQQRHLSAVGHEAVGEPDQRCGADTATDQQHALDARSRLEPTAERSDDAHDVAGVTSCEPFRAAANQVEEYRELLAAVGRAAAVDRECASQQRVGVLANEGHHELPGRRRLEASWHREPEDVRVAVQSGALGDLQVIAIHRRCLLAAGSLQPRRARWPHTSRLRRRACQRHVRAQAR